MNNVEEQWTADPDDLTRFQPYGLNYAIWQDTEDDDGSLEAHYSFKYALYDCRRNGKGKQPNKPSLPSLTCANDAYWQPAVFFSYTGEFDFYMGTRSSSPVINRLNNPALHFHALIDQENWRSELEKNRNSVRVRFLDIGIEHRSNGQDRDIEERNAQGELLTVVADQTGDHAFFDSISRSANYVSFAIGSMNVSASAYNYQVSAKVYWDDNSEVNWGSKAADNPSFRDYDILRIYLSKKFKRDGASWFPNVTFAAEYAVGAEMLDTDSADVMLIAPLHLWDGAIEVPLIAKIHFGPMDTLSNYTKSVTSFGLGVAFLY